MIYVAMLSGGIWKEMTPEACLKRVLVARFSRRVVSTEVMEGDLEKELTSMVSARSSRVSVLIHTKTSSDSSGEMAQRR